VSNASTFFAPPGKRLWAGCFDMLTVAVIFLPIAATGEGLGWDLDKWNVLGIVFVAYHFICLAFRDGRTLGKTAMDICVVTTDARRISIRQSAMRTAFRAAPFALTGTLELDLLGFGTLGGLMLIEMTRIETSPTRQSLADRIAGTVVANIPPLQPHRAPAGPMFSAGDAEFGGFPRRPPKDSRRQDARIACESAGAGSGQ
jgi:uncharacterized RDD family membrane protein YckC